MIKTNEFLLMASLSLLLTTASCQHEMTDPSQPDSDQDTFLICTDTDIPSESQEADDEIGLPACSGTSQAWVTDFEVRQPIDFPEPLPREPFLDSIFGTCIIRVTDRTQDLSPGDPSSGMKNEYSRVQSFNSDFSLVIVRSIEAFWYIYDIDKLEPIKEIPVSLEPRWDPVDPEIIYYTEEARLLSYNVRTDDVIVVHDFTADFSGQSLAAVWTRHEGRPSADGRYWGFIAQDEDWDAIAFLVYDLHADNVISIRDLRSVSSAREGIDHVTMSPSGTNFLASFDQYCEHGQLGDDTHPCGLMVYDRDLANGRSLLRIIGHYDTALDDQGREVVVFQDIDEDTISMLDLESGTATPLFTIDFTYTNIGFHFSGCAYDRPGWALISTHDGDPGSYTWMDDQVFAIELKPGGKVVRFVHTHSLVDEEQEHDYWAEPHASVNQNFTRILFTSNWGRSGTGEVDMYLIELPGDWSE